MDNTNATRQGHPQGAAPAEPLAIVGVGCRFPGGADTPEAFWHLLRAGTDTLSAVPPDRWDASRFTDSDPGVPGTTVSGEAGFLSQPIDLFDAEFFGVSPREAACLDPQQRLLLEVTWEALEDAGIPADALAGSRTGVYVGGFTTDSLLHQLGESNRDHISPQTATSATLGMLANRVSYLFDFVGPSITIDTACSSSLVALNYACRDLWQSECDLALAAGVNVMLKPEYAIAMAKGSFLAADSRSKAFDARANGYARGEGAGTVVLKRLNAALDAGDRIYALIRGTGVNQDGRTSGITVPNPAAQEALIRRVFAQFAIDPGHVTYVEAHGTGTPVGDPIETHALGAVFGPSRKGADPCPIGSVKANIGHLEAAAGIAGTIKAALMLSKRAIPPQILIQDLNPGIPFDRLGLRVPLETEPLSRNGGPACISVNSFGFGGTNAHAVLGEAPQPRTHSSREFGPGPWLMPLSARSRSALVDLARAYRDQLRDELTESARPFNVPCHAMAVRRSHHRDRLAIVTEDRGQALVHLDAFLAGDRAAGLTEGVVPAEGTPGPVFVFTGMGPQWWAMGRELMDEEPVFKAAVEEADVAFRAHAGWSILDAMAADEEISRMFSNEIAQPANFVLQVGLLALWQAWGVKPAAIVGHSVGEVAASYAAGALTLMDAARVSFHRSQCQQKLAGQGTMLAVGLDQETALRLVALYPGRVDLASINGPSSVVLAGDPAALDEIAAALATEGVYRQPLRVEVAYHSHQMDPLEGPLVASLEGLAPVAPALPLYSSVTASRVTAPLHDPCYWWQNVRQPVRFADTATAMIRNGYELFLEIGPHPVMAGAIQEAAARVSVRASVLSSLKRGVGERQSMLLSLAKLYCTGVAVDWSALFGPACPHLPLPLYPWQRQRHWTESDRARLDRLGSDGDVLLGRPETGPDQAWRSELTRRAAAYLWDHKVDGSVVFPGAAYVQMMLAAQRASSPETFGVLEDIAFETALVFGGADKPVLRTRLSEDGRTVIIHGQRAGDGKNWSVCARGRHSQARPRGAVQQIDLAGLRNSLADHIDPGTLYAGLAQRGLDYGPAFRGIQSLSRRPGEVLAEVAAHPSIAFSIDFGLVHATMLDASFQALIAALDDAPAVASEAVFVPMAIRRLSLVRPMPERVWCHGRLTHQSPNAISGEIDIYDEDGDLLLRVEGFRCQSIPRARSSGAQDRIERWLYRSEWCATEPVSFQAPGMDAGAWIIVSGESQLSDGIASRLARRGVPCFQVWPGSAFERKAPMTFRLTLDDADHWSRLLAALDETPIQGIVYLGGDARGPAKDDPTGITTTTRALKLLQGLAGLEANPPPRLVIVTCGVHRLGLGEQQGLGQSGLWGLGRVAMNEHPELGCTLVDIGSTHAASDVDALVAEVLAGDREDEVALRAGARLVYRLRRATERADDEVTREVRSASEPFVLEIAAPGDINSARFVACQRRPPAAGEVELRLLGVSLNFKDILKTMGVLSADVVAETYFGTSIGMEAAAEVVGVGSGVEGYSIGERWIVTLPGGCFRGYATVPAAGICSVPVVEGHDPLALAGMPIAFVTAYYGLSKVAHLQPGERVLVHSASGGVGLAAVQVAQWLGAEIYATAGSGAKRDYLRSLGLEHVFDSRSLDFADDVMAAAGGAGVDVVLSFLPGEAQEKSVGLLAPFGRFIEIGKRDIDENRGLGLKPFNRNLVFAAIDIDRMIALKPALFEALLMEVWDGIREGHFRPIPSTVFAVADFVPACQAMRRAQHIGKILVRIEGEELPVVPMQNDPPLFGKDVSYLVTGGFGGFGLKVAEWMVGEGATHLVLIGRSGAGTAEARSAVDRLEARGVAVLAAAVDVADTTALTALVDQIEANGPPLRGIFHAAGVLDDGWLVDLDPERFTRVMRAKAGGAWHLHQLTLKRPLDYFVLFSSVSALVGNPGQGNYAAANAFLDGLASVRAEKGLAATSINWGALADVGMAARNPSLEARLNRLGVGSLPPDLALASLRRVLREKGVQVGVMDVDWERWRHANPVVGESRRFSELIEAASGAAGAATALLADLASASGSERERRMVEALAGDVADVLRLPADRLDIDRPLVEIGADSLMMVEIQLAVERRIGLDVAVMELSRGFSVLGLARHLLGRLTDEVGLAEADPGDQRIADPAACVGAMSDHEVEGLLADLLQGEDALNA